MSACSTRFRPRRETDGGAGASDREQQCSQGHRRLADRYQAGPRSDRRERARALRSQRCRRAAKGRRRSAFQRTFRPDTRHGREMADRSQLDRWTGFSRPQAVHVRDMLSDEGAAFPDARKMGQSTGSTVHTVLSVPLLLEKESIGAICCGVPRYVRSMASRSICCKPSPTRQ